MRKSGWMAGRMRSFTEKLDIRRKMNLYRNIVHTSKHHHQALIYKEIGIVKLVVKRQGKFI